MPVVCLQTLLWTAVFVESSTQPGSWLTTPLSPLSPGDQMWQLPQLEQTQTLGAFLSVEPGVAGPAQDWSAALPPLAMWLPGKKGAETLGQPKTRMTSGWCWPRQGLESVRNVGESGASLVGRRSKLRFWLHRLCREPQTPTQVTTGLPENNDSYSLSPELDSVVALLVQCVPVVWVHSLGPLYLPQPPLFLSCRRHPSCYTTDPRWTCCKPSQTQPTPNALHGKNVSWNVASGCHVDQISE